MTTSATQVRNLFRRLAKVDTEPVFYGFLGDAHGVIKADEFGNVNVILFNGQVIVARNNVAPLISRLPVAVGYDKRDPKLLRVLKVWNVYENIGTPEVQPHGGSHTWPAPDFVPVRQEQILPGLAMAAGGMLVQLFGFYYFLAGQYHIVNHQTFDLTPYIPTSGAQWVNVEVDAASVISYNVGSLVANRDVLLPEDIPATASNKKLLVSIKCYEGQVDIIQTEFSTDIFDPRLSGYSTGGPATSVAWDDIADKPVVFPADLYAVGDGFRFGAGGRLAVYANIDSPLIVEYPVNIYRWMVYLKSTGSSGTSTFDINKNGVTVFTDQANRPSLVSTGAAGQTISGEADVTSFVAGDIITFDIDAAAVGADGLSAVGSVLIPVVITADAGQYKLAGDLDPALTYSSSISGLTFTGALSRASGSSVGTYAITQGTLTAPTGYSIIFVSDDFSIIDTITATGASVIDTWAGSSAYLIDANDATSWESATHRNANPWCQIDLGALSTMVRVRLLQDATSWSATQFKIETSPDGSTWTLQFTSATGITTAEHIVEVPFVSARYIKVTCIGGSAGSGWIVYDVSVKGL